MKLSHNSRHIKGRPSTKRASGRVAIVILVVACLVVGFAGGALWYYQKGHSSKSAPTESDGRLTGLSQATQTILEQLRTPVEIRYYSVLDFNAAPATMISLAQRVDRLLNSFENAAGSRLSVVRYNSVSESDAEQAASDGMRGILLDNGDICFLGLAVMANDRKELLPTLTTDWEPALEYDLSRMIARVAAPTTPIQSADEKKVVDSTKVATVSKMIPNVSNVSLEQGKSILQQAALDEFARAKNEMEGELRKVQEALQSATSEARQRELRDELLAIQTEQTHRLQEIAANLQDQISALEYLKSLSTPTPVSD